MANARDLIVRLIADTETTFNQRLRKSAKVTTEFEKTLKSVGVTATQSANAQISAAVRKDARLREEVALYRQIAAAAEKGSREQIIATNLAERSQKQLARSMSTTEHEARLLSGSTRKFNHDLSAATRGALSGSGIFRGLGRSIVFASGGFLAFGSASAFLRKSIDAAKEADVVNAQLETQFRATGRSLEPYRAEIDKTSNALSALSGFQNDELKAGLTTILRTQPDVSKALRDEALAADLARAKHVAYAKAAQDVARAEGGNLTALRRTLPVFGKHATVEAALAKVRAAVAGQARAGTTEQERFGAVLHTTEEIIGTGVLPTLNEYLARGSVWLEQMNESGNLQRDVAHAAHEFEGAVHDAGVVIHTVDGITGSFKNTLELLLALKVFGWARTTAAGIGLIGGAAATSEAELTGLQGMLASLTARRFVIAVAIAITAEQVGKALGENLDFSPGSLGSNLHHPFRNWKGPLLNWVLGNGWESDLQRSQEQAAAELKSRLGQTKDELANQVADFLAKTPGFFGDVPEPLGPPNPNATTTTTTTATPPKGLTAAQRNTFFDNAIARLLRRGGLGDIQAQIDALVQADALIAKRIAATKDVTRRQNLEDELLTNQAQIRQLKAEQATNATQAAEEAHQALLDKLQKIAEARNARQFRALGLTSGGETRAPSVRQLRNALGKFEDTVEGTFLDTKKTQSIVGRIRKVLAGGLGAVGRDVRLKIQEMLADLNKQLDDSVDSNLPKWKHKSAEAILAGVPNLTVAQKRLLEEKISQLGPGGTVPPSSTKDFALAGRRGDRVLFGDVTMDGEKVGTITKSHQIKKSRQRTVPRSG